ncbi:MAG: two pore domain potassium channel family protein [Pseudorhodoplanes sp.]|nr:two pore domain potassium channel family protein [Pseudorhodoplanes sp.]
MFTQLALAGLVSVLNFGIHALTTGLIVIATQRAIRLTYAMGVFGRVTVLLLIAVTVLTAAHVLEVGVWAIFFGAMGVAPQGDIAVYDFAFENYVALGYGDAVPPSDRRLYAPLCSLNGLLLIGWSVAIIFEVLRLAEVRIGRRRHRRRPGG